MTRNRQRAARQAWKAVVYPWGVATLDQGDPGFHPYHVAPRHYHKDAAYHNGAVWPWLNGIAIQRMLELGQADLAWRRGCQEHSATSNSIRGSAPESCTHRMSDSTAAGGTRGDCGVSPHGSTSTSCRSNGTRSPPPPATRSSSSKRQTA
ncbi:MAG: hypothetical protein KA760_06380 [Steroidobacteraceae bacterium]|nr:hypothetical protein [Steroidobacteraceae bacterium]MBP9129199.1 hypothetical protein [Steroidobacteraceae bacterium]